MAAVAKLTPEVITCVAEAIEQGCYASVAGLRAGISHNSFYLWSERGKREATARALESDAPMSLYEQFYSTIEAAKATARFDAEVRVFKTQPLAWLKAGYARSDWRESDQIVRAVADEMEKRASEALAATPAPRDPVTLRETLRLLASIVPADLPPSDAEPEPHPVNVGNGWHRTSQEGTSNGRQE